MIELARRLSESRAFHNVVLGVILLTAVALGIETADEFTARHRALFDWIDLAIQVVFVLEIAIRLLAHWPRLLRFFADGWNVFDFTIVVASLLPQAGTFAVVARLARLLRVTRLVSAFPELRLIVSTMLRSIPSMGHVLVMLGLLLYVYAVVGIYLFRGQDAERWGDLGAAFLTLFQILTLEGWVEVQAKVLPAQPFAWAYFASFVFVGVFVVVNLFIAVVINNLEAAKAEHQAEADQVNPHHHTLEAIHDIRERLDRLESLVRGHDPRDADGRPVNATTPNVGDQRSRPRPDRARPSPGV